MQQEGTQSGKCFSKKSPELWYHASTVLSSLKDQSKGLVYDLDIYLIWLRLLTNHTTNVLLLFSMQLLDSISQLPLQLDGAIWLSSGHMKVGQRKTSESHWDVEAFSAGKI